MIRRMGITGRIVLLVVAGTGMVMLAVMLLLSLASRRMLEAELKDKMITDTTGAAYRIEAVQRAIAHTTTAVADRIGAMHETVITQQAPMILTSLLTQADEVSGAALCIPGSQTAFSIIRSDSSANRQEFDIGMVETEDWYTLPRDLDAPVWTEPYYDAHNRELMVRYAAPVRRNGAFIGVLAAEVSLDWLSALMKKISADSDGYAFLVSGRGTYITHPRSEFVMNETLFSVAEMYQQPIFRSIGRRVLTRQPGIESMHNVVNGRASFTAWAPVPATGWSVLVIAERGVLMARVLRFNHLTLAMGGVGLLLLIGVAVMIGRSISIPIRQLDRATQVIAGGDLTVPVPIPPGDDELTHLAGSFDKMRTDIQRYINDLRTSTAARERIESELNIARSIQMDLVPRTFPPYPDRPEFDLYAMLEPAKEIGGDFYDFFFDINGHLVMVIGDVSGKGVPAALFMAVTRTLFRSAWRETGSPAQALKRTHDELSHDNETCMFVTMYCCVLDPMTGHCRIACGGHNPPLLVRNGEVQVLPNPAGPMVGAPFAARFMEGTLDLLSGDTLFLYTDGVTEAMDTAGELFGMERTCEGLLRCLAPNAQQTAHRMREAVRAHAAGAEQSDDITMLVFRYNGPVAGPIREAV